MMVEHKQVCFECGGKYYAKGLCDKCYCQRPEVKAHRKAYQKAYCQRPEVKAHRKAYCQRPELKAYQKAYRQRPEVKAYHKAYDGGVGVHGEQKAARLEKAALDKGFTPESAKAFAVDGLVLEKRLTELMKSG